MPTPPPEWRPSREEIAAAAGRTISDVLVHGLDLVFCGINPGLYSGATGHHFARPGNRFWPALHGSGFTDRLLSPFEDGLLPRYGLGITNLVARATATAAELSRDELREGGKAFEAKLRRYRPGGAAIVGVGAYRTAFDHPDAVVGPQPEPIGGVPVWVLPNPSGLNAHYRLPHLVAAFAELRQALDGRFSTAGAGRARRSGRSSRSSSSR